MKKNLVIVVSLIMIICLVGCNDKSNKDETDIKSNTKNTQESSNEQETETKKISSIANEDEDPKNTPKGVEIISDPAEFPKVSLPQEYDEAKDADFNSQEAFDIVITSKGCFYKKYAEEIFNLDIKTNKASYLCNKPNCNHEINGLCNSREMGLMRIFEYEDEIKGMYIKEGINSETNILENSIVLAKVNSDGSGIKDEKTFMKVEINNNKVIEMYLNQKVHRGYIYFYYNVGSSFTTGKDYYLNNSHCLFRYKLDGTQELELIKAFSLENEDYLPRIYASGSYVYFEENYKRQYKKIYRYDVENNQVQRIDRADLEATYYLPIKDKLLTYEYNKKAVEIIDINTYESKVFHTIPEEDLVNINYYDGKVIITSCVTDGLKERIYEYYYSLTGEFIEKKELLYEGEGLYNNSIMYKGYKVLVYTDLLEEKKILKITDKLKEAVIEFK